jgi:hypothetical protein
MNKFLVGIGYIVQSEESSHGMVSQNLNNFKFEI